MANKKISEQTNNITTLDGDVWIRAIENQSTTPRDGYLKASQLTVDTTAIHKATSGEIASITEKGTPIDADVILIEDSADSNNKKRIQIGSLPIPTVDSTKIQDTAGTTSVDSEDATYGDQIILKAPAATTDKILQLFSGTNPNFQVDGNGTILNNGYECLRIESVNKSVLLGTESSPISISNIYRSVIAGYLSGTSATVTADCVFVGYSSGKSNTSGAKNTFIGKSSGLYNVTGSNNVFIGYNSGVSQTANTHNTYIGYSSGSSNKQNGNVFLGAYSGSRQTVLGNSLIIDNQQRINAATELTDSLIVGTFDADRKLQRVNVNGVFKPIDMTTTEITALPGVAGDIVYNSTTNKHQGYNGTIWNDLY